MKYRISFLRKIFIKRNFIEWSFGKSDDFQPKREIFDQLKHPAELHFIAENYNWDDGAVVLEWILESDLCSKSTANLLFWRAAPDWYLKYDLDDIEGCPEYNRDGLVIIKAVLTRHKENNFNDISISFDPTAELEELTSKERKWEVPQALYEKIEGITVK